MGPEVGSVGPEQGGVGYEAMGLNKVLQVSGRSYSFMSLLSQLSGSPF